MSHHDKLHVKFKPYNLDFKNPKNAIGLIVVILLTALGVHLLFNSHAASPYAQAEAESTSNTITSPATVQSDTNASGSKYVQFGAPSGGGGTGYSHVVMVIDENYTAQSIFSGSPYFASLETQGEWFSGYHGLSHPSEPNYLGLFSGSTQGMDGSDNCITSSAKSFAGEMLTAGVSIKGYIEGLSSGSGYACRHDPFSQFTDAKTADTDFSNFPTTATGYAALPKFSLVIPNLTDDMHDSNPSTGGQWAQAHLDGYTQWAKTNNSIIIYLTDENDSDPNYSANEPGENGNNALALVVGSGITAGKNVTTNYDHYSTLRTLEDWYGLGRLGASASASDLAF